MSGVSCLPYSGRRIAVSGLMFVRVVLPGTAVLVATHEGAVMYLLKEHSLAQKKVSKADRRDKREKARRKGKRDEKKKEEERGKGEIIDT
ncbi:unnamed protein product [Lasius platythorax]|uniref:Uncharacterized protein n=1 Tax=Lasius platythorax TaxID=488582 RepID=A0AAV2P5G9_9HYME